MADQSRPVVRQRRRERKMICVRIRYSALLFAIPTQLTQSVSGTECAPERERERENPLTDLDFYGFWASSLLTWDRFDLLGSRMFPGKSPHKRESVCERALMHTHACGRVC